VPHGMGVVLCPLLQCGSSFLSNESRGMSLSLTSLAACYSTTSMATIEVGPLARLADLLCMHSTSAKHFFESPPMPRCGADFRWAQMQLRMCCGAALIQHSTCVVEGTTVAFVTILLHGTGWDHTSTWVLILDGPRCSCACAVVQMLHESVCCMLTGSLHKDDQSRYALKLGCKVIAAAHSMVFFELSDSDCSWWQVHGCVTLHAV
jgi:hypothetical protein